MTNDERTKLFDEIISECRNLLITKGSDYAGDNDVLSNFKYTASRIGVTKYQSWFFYLDKHVEAIRNGINRNPAYPDVHSEGLRSRVHDLINYSFLLACLLEEDSKNPDR